jgi:uncharacterized protein YhhL (DUF1145 family)
MLKYSFIFLLLCILLFLAELITLFVWLIIVNTYIIPYYSIVPLTLTHMYILTVPLALIRLVLSFEALDKATRSTIDQMEKS